jgi:NADH-quinone oxidoreductase subunit E
MVEEVLETSMDEFISAGFTANKDELISLLQYTQKKNGYISRQSADKIAKFLGISEAQVFTVASFYAQFRFHPPGENHVRVCLGTACHVQGGRELSRGVRELLGVHAGETTPDGRFDFEEVACLGCCAQAAVVEVNGKIFAKMSRDKLRKVLVKHE